MLKTLLVLLTFAALAFSYGQRGKDLSYTVTAASTQLNAYTNVTANISPAATTITVASNTLTNSFFTNALAAGDLIMIIQMRGATMDIDPSLVASGFPFTTPYGHNYDWWLFKELWGQVTAYNNAGKYELAEVRSVSGGTSITLQCGVKNVYTATGRVQVVRVPRLVNLSLNAGSSLVPAAWNGTTGGVIALEVNGNVTFGANSKISATGSGFRGGITDNTTLGSPPGDINNSSLLGTPNSTEGAEKGEGIGGWTTEYAALSSRYGRGAPANAGGGGGNHNSGGGGGPMSGPGPIPAMELHSRVTQQPGSSKLRDFRRQQARVAEEAVIRFLPMHRIQPRSARRTQHGVPTTAGTSAVWAGIRLRLTPRVSLRGGAAVPEIRTIRTATQHTAEMEGTAAVLFT